MLTVGQPFPEFSLTGVVSADPDKAFQTITDKSYPGKWLVVFAWPKDFTFVCPTEIVGFDKVAGDFADRDAQLLGLSVDSEFVHAAWRQHHKDLTNVSFPWLSDVKHELSEALGIIHPVAGVCLRATFIVDPTGVIRHASANDLEVGRNPQEYLRLLDAFQTGELCPCNWKKGQKTLTQELADAK